MVSPFDLIGVSLNSKPKLSQLTQSVQFGRLAPLVQLTFLAKFNKIMSSFTDRNLTMCGNILVYRNLTIIRNKTTKMTSKFYCVVIFIIIFITLHSRILEYYSQFN